MKPHLQCAEKQVSPSNLTKYCACHAERLTYLVLITYETSFTVRGATDLPVQHHQILRLSHKIALQNFIANVRKLMIRHFQCGADPSMIRPSIFYCKIQNFAPNLTFKPSPNTVPATKSDTSTSRSTAPATKSDTWPSPSTAPATKSDTGTTPSTDFTELWLYWTVTLLNCDFTELWLYWSVTLLNCYFTELWLYWTVTLLYWLYWTVTLLYWTVTLLNCDFTELLLYWTVTLLYWLYWTVTLLYWTVTLLRCRSYIGSFST